MFFLDYQVTHGSYVTYVIYVFLSMKGSQLTVTLYNVNPSAHTVTSINASIAPQEVFANLTSGLPGNFELGGKNISALTSGNLTVSLNGVILYQRQDGWTQRLVAANYPGLANDSFPNLSQLAGERSVLSSNPEDLAVGVVVSAVLFLVSRELIRDDAR
ncbi:hypothetical protein HS1genome_1616 [Sulfodiicoccus acidiphilus]|uniref:Uncharacterized protein n=1 Tax=Sulfodiicoccus acidiphilus TaxID=1670455 RepID=A0A348B4X5_9CREN|nr:hypothetical protein [Sulfodiicoccus acidiphilus]BBD73227.1 hypothetical protein HS1genome_1616 [Sulfodiicoccus acidiphilus]GGT89778.1 hypothetical protein GCM10007116_04530 [Sulfodiicoccus acidiphilus]